MPLGSNTRTVAPPCTSRSMFRIDGASRMWSVSGLKVSPSTAGLVSYRAPARGDHPHRHAGLAGIIHRHYAFRAATVRRHFARHGDPESTVGHGGIVAAQ